jgi:hypothetical protein
MSFPDEGVLMLQLLQSRKFATTLQLSCFYLACWNSGSAVVLGEMYTPANFNPNNRRGRFDVGQHEFSVKGSAHVFRADCYSSRGRVRVKMSAIGTDKNRQLYIRLLTRLFITAKLP